MEIEKVTLVTAIATLIITGVMAYISIYDRWIKPWRERINEKNRPGFEKEYFKCLWCKKYAKHERVESQQETRFKYTACTKCSKKLIWSNYVPRQIIEPLEIQRRCVSCQKVSLHELEDVVSKEILVDSDTGDLFYRDSENIPLLTTEQLKSMLSNKPNDVGDAKVYSPKPKVYTSRTMKCYERRCTNKKCKELHYWTENNRIIWEIQ